MSTSNDGLMERVLSRDAFLLFDGAFGTLLQRSQAPQNVAPPLLNLQMPELITQIHQQYVDAGSDIITTNTFTANRLKLNGTATVQEVFAHAIACAQGAHPHYIAADIGPLGELLDPYGDITHEEAYNLFAEQARAASDAGADILIIETMADIQEARIAIQACKAESDLPVFATMTFGASGRSFMGATPEDAARALTAEGVDALGINCSLGPIELLPLIETMRANTNLPLIVQANAGLPNTLEDGSVTYPFSVTDYVEAVRPIIAAGATIIGGCCGTDPAYIRALRKILP